MECACLIIMVFDKAAVWYHKNRCKLPKWWRKWYIKEHTKDKRFKKWRNRKQEELNDKEKARGDKFGRVNGPQVEIEATKEKGAESGYVYGEALGGWMTPKDKLIPHKNFKNGKWNKYRILAKGPIIQTWVNGKQVSDLKDEEKYKSHSKGFIGLQVHGIKKGTGPYEVAWRNIKIKEL